MAMKEEEKKSWKTTLEYLLTFVWLTSMALGGFFLPESLNSIPAFRIKEVQVFGVRSIPPEVLSSALYQVSKNSWLFLDSERFLAKANALTNNSISSIKVEKSFSWDGAIVRITVQERVPIASVVHNKDILFVDEKGEFFYNPAIEDKLPIVYAVSLDYVKKHFFKLKDLTDYIKEMKLNISEIYITDKNTIVYVSGRKIILPSLSRLDLHIIDRIRKIYNKIGMELGDVLILSDGIAVIKEGK